MKEVAITFTKRINVQTNYYKQTELTISIRKKDEKKFEFLQNNNKNLLLEL
jgi:hypothetical protein